MEMVSRNFLRDRNGQPDHADRLWIAPNNIHRLDDLYYIVASKGYMSMYKNIFVVFLLLCSQVLQAQSLSGISTRWSDELTEWDIYTLEGDQEILEEDGEEYIEVAPTGQLMMRWQMDLNWAEWDFTVDGVQGSMRQLWKDDPTQWELRIGNEVVTCRAAWRDDLSEWRITNNKKTLTWRSKYRRNLNEWELRGNTYGAFYVYTTFLNDPRDWTIVDELDNEIPFSMKMAMTFLAVYHGLDRQ